MSATDGFTAAPPAKLAVQHVSKWFRTPRASVHALDDVGLDVDGGEFVCVLGPSGCGKSTLGPGRHRLVMFQESALFPWLNVFGNVMFGLRRAAGLSGAQRRQIAEYHLNLVGLAKFRKAYVHELSGGMKQRAALARSLAPDPRVLLMDEPFASLDGLTREQLYFDLQRIWEERKKTIVLVTHNVREAVCLGDRVALMSPSPGRIREEFAVKLPRPRDINTAEVAALAQRITSALKGL